MSLIGEGAKDANMWGSRWKKMLSAIKSLLCERADVQKTREKIETPVAVVVQAYNRFRVVYEAGKERVGGNDIIGARISDVDRKKHPCGGRVQR